MNLRQYQLDAVAGVMKSWESFNKSLMVVPTGGGKTVIFSEIVKQRMKFGPVLIIAHREELLEQARNKLGTFGITSFLEKAEHSATLQAPVVVGSIQTLNSRLEKWKQHFQTIIIDEAHHATAESYLNALKHIGTQDCKFLGVTATADRADKKSLGTYFEDVAYEINLISLIKQKYLSPIMVRSCQCNVDLSNVRTVAGDLNAGESGNAIEPHLADIARQIKQYASDRKILIFLPLVATAEKMNECLIKEGFKSACVSGDDPDRKLKISGFAWNQYQVLCNSMLLTEGYDCPQIDCVVVLRPTKSRGLYSQMVGRGTRIHEGKKNLLLLDFLWMTGKHSLVKPANLLAKDDAEAKAMSKAIESQDEMDLELAVESATEEREQSLKAALLVRRKPRPGMIDPLDFSLMVHDTNSEDFEPTMDWHYLPITEGQQKSLGGMGIDVGLIANRGHASALLNVMFDRRKLNLATPKQVRYLTKIGHKSPNTVSFNEANEIITNDITEKNSWNK